MPSARKGARPVAIPVTFRQVTMWKCAAALEPVPPTWLGLSWSEVLATPIDWHRGRMTLDIPSRILAKQPRCLERDEVARLLGGVLHDHAQSILERHGLKCIPDPARPRSDMEDEIPF